MELQRDYTETLIGKAEIESQQDKIQSMTEESEKLSGKITDLQAALQQEKQLSEKMKQQRIMNNKTSIQILQHSIDKLKTFNKF